MRSNASDLPRVLAGHHAVDVRMWSERLSPGVQDGQEASVCAKVLRIGKDLEQCGGAGLKEQGEQLSLVLPDQRHKLMWDAEDEMIVAYRQQFLLTLLKPLVARSGLTLGCGRSCTRWLRARSLRTHRDDRRGQRCGSARWHRAPCAAAKSMNRCTVGGSCLLQHE
jgi:hypothetical protein